MTGPKKRNRKGRPRLFTKGERNKLADAAIHPTYKLHEGFRLLDGLVHSAIEQNPKESLKKFLKYNSADLVEELWRMISRQEK